MSVAFVRHHTAGKATTSGTTVAATVVTADVGIGSVLIAWVGFQNLTLTTPVSSISKMAGETNSWVRIASHDSDSPSAGASTRGEMWAIKTTVAWTVATAVTATLSGAVTYRNILLSEFSGAEVAVRGVAGSGLSVVGTPSASTSGAALVADDLVLGGATWNNLTTPTGDGDTTSGVWSAAQVTGGGTNLATVMQYKVVTATGVQTFNPTGASNSSGAVVVALATNHAPNASNTTSPATGATVDRAVTQRLEWDFSDDDPGDSQSAYDLQYRIGTAAWTTVSDTTTNSFWDAPPATFPAGAYEWQVRTYDAQGLVGPWSASSFFTAADSPGVPSITAPTSGSTVAASDTVSWSVAAQTDYQVRRVADLAGVADTATVYYDSGDVVDGTTRSVVVAFPTNGRWEHVQVRVKAAGLWSTWADCRVQVSWTAPMVPTLTATPDSATANISVVITNPAPTAGEPATSYNDVFVSSPLDVEYRAATLVPPNSTWVWRKAGAARVYTVRVEAVGSNGTTSTSA